MATSGGSSGEYEDGVRDIMDELICTICEEDRPLHVLPCQHRFCKICLDQLSSKGHKSFPCPKCRQVYKAPRQGFKLCRLSAFVKEKLLAVPITPSPANSDTLSSISRDDLKSLIQEAVKEEIYLHDTRRNPETDKVFTGDQQPSRTQTAGSAGDCDQSASQLSSLQELKDWYRRSKVQILPTPDQLKRTPLSAKLINRNLYDTRDSREVHCPFSYPLANRRIGNPNFTNLIEYIWDSTKEAWLEERKFKCDEATKILSFQSTYSTSDGEARFYLQCQRLKDPWCRLHSSRPAIVVTRTWRDEEDWICSCHTRASNPLFLYGLDHNWKQISVFPIHCATIHPCNNYIYGIYNPAYPRNCVLKYSASGELLSSISHISMVAPEYIKAWYISMLEKPILFVSDPAANKLFLFLDDMLCWMWQPEKSNDKVGPIAISTGTKKLYAVITEDDDDDDPSWTLIKVINLQGDAVGQLEFRNLVSRTRDIEAVCYGLSQDDIFVMFEDGEDHTVRSRWTEYATVSSTSGWMNLFKAFIYWYRVTHFFVILPPILVGVIGFLFAIALKYDSVRR